VPYAREYSITPQRPMHRTGALQYRAPRFFPTVSRCAVSIIYYITACGLTATMVLYFIGTVPPEPPEIHSGKLSANHMDLACELELYLPASTVKSYVSILPQFQVKLTRYLLSFRELAPPDCLYKRRACSPKCWVRSERGGQLS
jgi:hypothetical protein